MMRIAVVDDDAPTRSYLTQVLEAQGHNVTPFVNGREAISALTRDTFDLIIVDWNMPIVSGIEIISWARKNLEVHLPIIMLTNRSDEHDIVQALESGADDFIIKPEKASVISARVAALLRRTNVAQAAPRQQAFGRFLFDSTSSSVSLDGEDIPMTSKEYALALAFFQNQHRALSRAYLLETIWNSVADLPTRTLDVHVSRIRAKLKLSRENGFRLQTIFGFGYRLEAYDDES
jgi:DNA-binding response OmpR family regulator